jgi:hypothetical protein
MLPNVCLCKYKNCAIVLARCSRDSEKLPSVKPKDIAMLNIIKIMMHKIYLSKQLLIIGCTY